MKERVLRTSFHSILSVQSSKPSLPCVSLFRILLIPERRHAFYSLKYMTCNSSHLLGAETKTVFSLASSTSVNVTPSGPHFHSFNLGGARIYSQPFREIACVPNRATVMLLDLS